MAQIKNTGLKGHTRGSDDILSTLAEAHLVLNEKAHQLSDSTFQLTLAQSSLKEKATEILSLKMQLSKAQEENWEATKRLEELRQQEQLAKSEKQELEKKLQELQRMPKEGDIKASATPEKEMENDRGLLNPVEDDKGDDARAVKTKRNEEAARQKTPTKSDDGRVERNLEMSNVPQQKMDKDDFAALSRLPDPDSKAEEHRQFVKQV